MLCTLLPVLYLSVTCHTPKWPPHGNRRRAPGVIRLGFNGYGKTLVHALVTSTLDFENAALFGIKGTLLHRLEMVQRAAARVVLCIDRRDHRSMEGRKEGTYLFDQTTIVNTIHIYENAMVRRPLRTSR